MANYPENPWASIVKKAFSGNQRVRIGKPKVIVTAGVPANAAGDIVGLLCWDKTNSDAYICTVVDTTWVKINT